MSSEAVIERIAGLKKERNAVILAHNYQPAEIQDIADFLGDSLDLSRRAAETDADVIVFCGVHFMAETAAILSPRKTVLLPETGAGCPMADMITADQLRDLKRRHPGAVTVTYVNSSAEVKAESDVCCTSANAVDIVASLGASEILFIPDRNLARYVESRTGRSMVVWDGFCPVHDRITARDVADARRRHPGAPVLVHPECRLEVIDAADGVFSTTGMRRYAAETSDRELVIGTETGILHVLRRDNPEKVFHPLTDAAVCADMKRITPEKVLSALQDGEPVVSVEEGVAGRARKAIEQMLARSRPA